MIAKIPQFDSRHASDDRNLGLGIAAVSQPVEVGIFLGAWGQLMLDMVRTHFRLLTNQRQARIRLTMILVLGFREAVVRRQRHSIEPESECGK